MSQRLIDAKNMPRSTGWRERLSGGRKRVVRETEMRKMSAELSLPYVFPLRADAPAELVQLLG